MANKWTGERVRKLRERLGLTQGEMAERLGYAHYTAVLRLEKEEREPTGPVQKLLDVLEQEVKREPE